MSNRGLSWQHIAHLDPYLAGALATRGWEWWDETTAEQEANSVGLEGEQRSKFLNGWQACIDEQEQERIEERARERDQILSDAAGKGDPAAR